MNLLRIGLLALSASVIGCSKPAPPTVVLDGWWNKDYAKATCDQAKNWHQENAKFVAQYGCEAIAGCDALTPILNACALDPTMELRSFENSITTEFAANSRCNGIRLAYFSGSGSHGNNKALSEAFSGDYWQLMLDYKPGEQKQPWSMVRSGNASAYVEGSGDAHAIAARACDIIMQRGASIAN
jgi:hypothetical protein